MNERLELMSLILLKIRTALLSATMPYFNCLANLNLLYYFRSSEKRSCSCRKKCDFNNGRGMWSLKERSISFVRRHI